MCTVQKYFDEIGLNFPNFVSSTISIWLLNSFQPFVQIRTKFSWLEMKKRPVDSALTVRSNVIHSHVNIYFEVSDEQKYFMRGFFLDFDKSSLI